MEPVRVRVKDCVVPEHEEEGHGVYMAPTLSLEGGLAAEADITASGDKDALVRRLLVTFVRYGAVGWDFCDDGKAVPFDVNVLLSDYAIARKVAEKGDELYADAVLAPFRPAQPARSPTGSTGGTTSPGRTPTPLRRRSSSRRGSGGKRSLDRTA